MKVLFIKDGLNVGGTTSSFLTMISFLPDDPTYEFFVWINNYDKSISGTIPGHIKVINNKKLDKAFARQKNRIKRYYHMTITGQLWCLIQMYHNKNNKSKYIYWAQKQNIKRAESQVEIDLSEFDIVITWEELYPFYLLSSKIRTKHKVAWIHPDYRQCGFDSTLDEPFIRRLDAVVAVSKANLDTLITMFPQHMRKLYGISNSLDVEGIRVKAGERPCDIATDAKLKLVTVARIQNISKAIDRAIRIAEKLKSRGIKFYWYFIGDGEDLEWLKKEAGLRQVNDCVVFLGVRENPYGYIKNADLFVLQSYYEGRPVVVDEALALGTPVFVSDYKSAVEQVVSNEYGIVCENNEDKICQALLDLLENPQRLKCMRKAIESASFIEQYNNTKQLLSMLEAVYGTDKDS